MDYLIGGLLLISGSIGLVWLAMARRRNQRRDANHPWHVHVGQTLHGWRSGGADDGNWGCGSDSGGGDGD